MEFTILPLSGCKRSLASSAPRLAGCGWLKPNSWPAKKVVYRTVDVCFQFNPAAENEGGAFRSEGKLWRTDFPLLEVHTPGMKAEHLPCDCGISELYFSYKEEDGERVVELFKNAGLLLPSGLVQPFGIEMTERISSLAMATVETMKLGPESGNAERLDLMAELLTLEAVLNMRKEGGAKDDPLDFKTRAVAEAMRADPKNFDLRRALKKNALNLRSFQRRWAKLYSDTPHQRLMRCRLELAEKALSGSGLSLSEAAELAGFCDEYYLSRLFKREFGVAAGSFRRREDARLEEEE